MILKKRCLPFKYPGAIGFGKSSGDPNEDIIGALRECGMSQQRAQELVEQYGWEEALKRAQYEDF